MSTASLVDPGELPPAWRDHYAELAAAWVRARGTRPPSLTELARWAAEELEIPLEAELAYLEGRGPDPCPQRSSPTLVPVAATSTDIR